MLSDIEKMAGKWAEIACPIFGDSNKRYVSAQSFGTGFVASVGEDLYFFTAFHVVNDFGRYAHCVANVGGKSLDISSLCFHGDKASDIAFAKIEREILLDLSLPSVKYCPLSRNWAGWTELDTFVAIGYPASRNELKLCFGSTDRNCLNIFAHKSQKTIPKSSLPTHFGLQYDPKRVVGSDGKSLRPPELKGMSGGPCFEIMSSGSDDLVRFSLKLRGLISEFHAKEKVIAVTPIETVIDAAR